MDGTAEQLREKLDELLKQAAEVSVALDRADGTIQEVPHYSVIEQRAHQLGRQLSCRIQAEHMTELAAAQHPVGHCPTCHTRCELEPDDRTVSSIDGKVGLRELKGHCPRCRKSFFPGIEETGNDA